MGGADTPELRAGLHTATSTPDDGLPPLPEGWTPADENACYLASVGWMRQLPPSTRPGPEQVLVGAVEVLDLARRAYTAGQNAAAEGGAK